MNQLAPWIRFSLHDNYKVHRANEVLKQLVFAFLSCLEQGAPSLSGCYNCGRSFAGNHCLRIEDFFKSLIKGKYYKFSTGIVGMQHAVAE